MGIVKSEYVCRLLCRDCGTNCDLYLHKYLGVVNEISSTFNLCGDCMRKIENEEENQEEEID